MVRRGGTEQPGSRGRAEVGVRIRRKVQQALERHGRVVAGRHGGATAAAAARSACLAHRRHAVECCKSGTNAATDTAARVTALVMLSHASQSGTTVR